MSPHDPAPPVSMLWENADPAATLRDRFGLVSGADAGRRLEDVLARRWGLTVRCERLVLSASNLLGWVRGPTGAYVVKACVDRSRFARLDRIAAVVARLGDEGLPVAPPVRTPDGALRVVLDGDLPLSVVVLPLIEGDRLDAADPEAVRATGAVLARAHRALAQVDAGTLGPTGADSLRPELRVSRDARLRAPGAARRLDALVARLPELHTSGTLVHGDVRGANVLLDRGRVTALLDWDELRAGHRVQDLAAGAVKLATAFRTWDPPPPGSRVHLVDGYRSVLPLTASEELWLEATVLAEGLGQIPSGADPAGWAVAVQRGL